MYHLQSKKPLVKALLFIMICLTGFMNSAKAGLDFYEIYLGKKLIFKRYVNQPLSMENLPVNQSNSGDQLVIHYFQCNAPGKTGTKRSIALKDDNGNIIKQWNYADANNSNAEIIIPVKELIESAKGVKSKTLSLVYSAEGRAGGEKIAYIAPGLKSVGYYKKLNDNIQSDMAGISTHKYSATP